MAYVYDGGTTPAANKIYIDGIQRDDNDFTSLAFTAIENLGEDIKIGGTGAGVGGPFGGRIDHTLFYKRILSASEISLLYREPFCMFERDPIELWSAATLGAPPVGNLGIMTTNTGFWGQQVA